MEGATFSMVFVTLLASCLPCNGQNVLGRNWSAGLLSDIKRLTDSIQGNVQMLNQRIQGNVRDLNERIQENVERQLSQIHRLQDDVNVNIGSAAGKTGNHNQGEATVIVSNPGSVSRSIFSGRTQDGQPYFRESEDRIEGDVLHHVDRIYDSTRRTVKEYAYTLNLTDPGASPVPVPAQIISRK